MRSEFSIKNKEQAVRAYNLGLITAKELHQHASSSLYRGALHDSIQRGELCLDSQLVDYLLEKEGLLVSPILPELLLVEPDVVLSSLEKCLSSVEEWGASASTVERYLHTPWDCVSDEEECNFFPATHEGMSFSSLSDSLRLRVAKVLLGYPDEFPDALISHDKFFPPELNVEKDLRHELEFATDMDTYFVALEGFLERCPHKVVQAVVQPRFKVFYLQLLEESRNDAENILSDLFNFAKNPFPSLEGEKNPANDLQKHLICRSFASWVDQNLDHDVVHPQVREEVGEVLSSATYTGISADVLSLIGTGEDLVVFLNSVNSLSSSSEIDSYTYLIQTPQALIGYLCWVVKHAGSKDKISAVQQAFSQLPIVTRARRLFGQQELVTCFEDQSFLACCIDVDEPIRLLVCAILQFSLAQDLLSGAIITDWLAPQDQDNSEGEEAKGEEAEVDLAIDVDQLDYELAMAILSLEKVATSHPIAVGGMLDAMRGFLKRVADDELPLTRATFRGVSFSHSPTPADLLAQVGTPRMPLCPSVELPPRVLAALRRQSLLRSTASPAAQAMGRTQDEFDCEFGLTVVPTPGPSV